MRGMVVDRLAKGCLHMTKQASASLSVEIRSCNSWTTEHMLEITMMMCRRTVGFIVEKTCGSTTSILVQSQLV